VRRCQPQQDIDVVAAFCEERGGPVTPVSTSPRLELALRGWVERFTANVPDVGMREMPVSHWLGVVDIHHFTHGPIFHQ